MAFIYENIHLTPSTWVSVKDHHLNFRHDLSIVLKGTIHLLLKMTLIKPSGDFGKPNFTVNT